MGRKGKARASCIGPLDAEIDVGEIRNVDPEFLLLYSPRTYTLSQSSNRISKAWVPCLYSAKRLLNTTQSLELLSI